MFNISVSSVITTGKESATSMNATHAMEQIVHQVRLNTWKNLINIELRLKNMHLDICKKWKVSADQQL